MINSYRSSQSRWRFQKSPSPRKILSRFSNSSTFFNKFNQYEIIGSQYISPWQRKQNKNRPIQLQRLQFSYAHSPGPAAYDPKNTLRISPHTKKQLIIKSKRFYDSSTKVPGPGTYQQASSINKRSFVIKGSNKTQRLGKFWRLNLM